MKARQNVITWIELVYKVDPAYHATVSSCSQGRQDHLLLQRAERCSAYYYLNSMFFYMPPILIHFHNCGLPWCCPPASPVHELCLALLCLHLHTSPSGLHPNYLCQSCLPGSTCFGGLDYTHASGHTWASSPLRSNSLCP